MHSSSARGGSVQNPDRQLSAASEARITAADTVSSRIQIGVLGPAASDVQLGHRTWLNLTVLVGPTETVRQVKQKVALNVSVAQLLRTRRRTSEGMRMLRAGGDELEDDQILQQCLLTDGKSQLFWPMQEQSDLTRVHPGMFPSPTYSRTFPDRLFIEPCPSSATSATPPTTIKEKKLCASGADHYKLREIWAMGPEKIGVHKHQPDHYPWDQLKYAGQRVSSSGGIVSKLNLPSG